MTFGDARDVRPGDQLRQAFDADLARRRVLSRVTTQTKLSDTLKNSDKCSAYNTTNS